MKIPISNHAVYWRGGGSFRPEGRLTLVHVEGLVGNPLQWDTRESWAARMFLGFQKGRRRVPKQEAARRMEKLVQLVREIRVEQVGDPGASFLTQRGMYRHDDGYVIDEPGAQVIVINVDRVMKKGKKIEKVPVTPEQFEKDIEQLSEDLATELDQESIIVEIQRNGVVQRTFSMGRR